MAVDIIHVIDHGGGDEVSVSEQDDGSQVGAERGDGHYASDKQERPPEYFWCVQSWFRKGTSLEAVLDVIEDVILQEAVLDESLLTDGQGREEAPCSFYGSWEISKYTGETSIDVFLYVRGCWRHTWSSMKRRLGAFRDRRSSLCSVTPGIESGVERELEEAILEVRRELSEIGGRDLVMIGDHQSFEDDVVSRMRHVWETHPK